MFLLQTKWTFPSESESKATILSFWLPPFTICTASVSTTSLAATCGVTIETNTPITINVTIIMLFLILLLSIELTSACAATGKIEHSLYLTSTLTGHLKNNILGPFVSIKTTAKTTSFIEIYVHFLFFCLFPTRIFIWFIRPIVHRPGFTSTWPVSKLYFMN